MNQAVDGMQGVRKFGANNSTPAIGEDTSMDSSNAEQEVAHRFNHNTDDVTDTDEVLFAVSPPRCSSSARTPNTAQTRFSRAAPKKQTLLEKQVNAQMEYHKRCLTVFGRNKQSFKRYS